MPVGNMLEPGRGGDLEQERMVPYSSSNSRKSLGELVWSEGRERGEIPSCL